jgi:hypothetical protein
LRTGAQYFDHVGRRLCRADAPRCIERQTLREVSDPRHGRIDDSLRALDTNADGGTEGGLYFKTG